MHTATYVGDPETLCVTCYQLPLPPLTPINGPLLAQSTNYCCTIVSRISQANTETWTRLTAVAGVEVAAVPFPELASSRKAQRRAGQARSPRLPVTQTSLLRAERRRRRISKDRSPKVHTDSKASIVLYCITQHTLNRPLLAWSYFVYCRQQRTTIDKPHSRRDGNATHDSKAPTSVPPCQRVRTNMARLNASGTPFQR